MPSWNFSRTEAVPRLGLLLVAIYFVPAGAHLFELPHKMALPPAEYMTVQRIYAGWALFGIVIAAALVATAVHAWLVRSDRTALAIALAALACLAATQVIF